MVMTDLLTWLGGHLVSSSDLGTLGTSPLPSLLSLTKRGLWPLENLCKGDYGH